MGLIIGEVVVLIVILGVLGAFAYDDVKNRQARRKEDQRRPRKDDGATTQSESDSPNEDSH